MATKDGTRPGMAVPAAISSGGSAGIPARASAVAMRQLRLVRDDADERLRDVIRALRDKYRDAIKATSGGRALLFLRYALSPTKRPTTSLPEVIRIFARANVSRDELRLTIGAWVLDEIVAATPATTTRTLAELRESAVREFAEAQVAAHAVAEQPKCESRWRTMLREFRQAIVVGGHLADASAETICARRQGW